VSDLLDDLVGRVSPRNRSWLFWFSLGYLVFVLAMVGVLLLVLGGH
jgi:hypothetical protein